MSRIYRGNKPTITCRRERCMESATLDAPDLKPSLTWDQKHKMGQDELAEYEEARRQTWQKMLSAPLPPGWLRLQGARDEFGHDDPEFCSARCVRLWLQHAVL